MTINPAEVQAVSAGPYAGGLPLPAEQVARITAVLNDNHHPRPAPGPEPRPQPTAPAATAPAPQLAVRAPGPATREPAGRPSATQNVRGQGSAGPMLARQQLLEGMRRAGCSPQDIAQAKDLLPPQVDRRRDQAALATLGLSTAKLMDRMGASP